MRKHESTARHFRRKDFPPANSTSSHHTLRLLPKLCMQACFNFFLDDSNYREKLKTMHVGVATNLWEYVTQKACARWSVSIRKVKCLYCCTAYSILQVNWTLQPCVSETTSALIKFVIKTTGANSFNHREGIKAVYLPTSHWLYLLVAETKLLPTIIV